ncbi:hypothetical protein ACSFC0_03665 [Serratia marcescens]|uniref:hypothetical protein n=1 Tax=Serratia marcescens TaxID=615 RepID=UPI003EDA4EFE
MKKINMACNSYNIYFLGFCILATFSTPSFATIKKDSVLDDFYSSYVISLLKNESCRNLHGLPDDTFILEYPESISSDDGTYMTNATANTSLYFQIKDGKVINFSVENGLIESSSNSLTKESYFCVISSAQSALFHNAKHETMSDLTRKLYETYESGGRSLISADLYEHSFSNNDSTLVYKLVNKS